MSPALERAAKRYVIMVGFDDCTLCKGTGGMTRGEYSGNGTVYSSLTCWKCLERAAKIVEVPA